MLRFNKYRNRMLNSRKAKTDKHEKHEYVVNKDLRNGLFLYYVYVDDNK